MKIINIKYNILIMECIKNTSYLSKNGYVIKKEYLSQSELNILKKELVGRPLVDDKYAFGISRNFLLYIETKSKIYIPKIYGIKRYGHPIKKLDNYIGKLWGDNCELKFIGEPLPTQIEASKAMMTELLDNTNGGILSIFTGGGKTFTAIYILSKLRGKTLVIVNKITLLKQWENEINTFLPGAKIGIIQGQKIDIEDKHIVLAMLQSLALIDYPANFLNDINTTIIDECFPYSTFVMTSRGHIQIGILYSMYKDNIRMPLIKTFNENTKKIEYNILVNVFRKINNILIEIICGNIIIKSTENHKYLTCDGWKKAIDLNINDFLYYNNGLYISFIQITNINKNINNIEDNSFVYDLEIENNHNYIVSSGSLLNESNGFIVHNCHNVPSKIFSKVLLKTSSQYTIGLSATPTRGDGCEYVFKYFIGDIIYQCKSDRKGLPPKINMIKIKSSDYKEITTTNKFTGKSQIQFTSMLSDLISMNKRNILIIELLKYYITTENRKILLLSDRREHLKSLILLLDNDPDIFFTYGLFVGQMKMIDLEKSKASSVILATFAAFSEGISEKNLDTLILTTPKKYIGHIQNTQTKNESGKLEQIVGRIFRKDHIDKSPLIIDLFDDFSIYRTQSNSRKIFYNTHFKTSIITNQSINLDKYNINNINYNCILSNVTSQINQSECLFID